MSKYIPKTTAWAHQNEAHKRGHAKVAFAYFMGTGTGKTKVIIDSAAEHYEDGNIDTLIVFANKGAYRNWASSELPVHLPDRIKNAVYIWDGKSTKQKEYEWKYVEQLNGLRILLFNIESLSVASSRAVALLEPFMKAHKTMMVIDESTVIKNVGSSRTKAAIRLGELATYRRILTGTPVTTGPLNLFSQFQFLGDRLLGCSSFYAFRARYAVLKKMDMGGRKFDVPVAYKNLDDLSNRVAPLSYRVVKEDCLDLPPKIYLKYETFMGDEQAAMYKSMRETCIAELENHEYVTATEVITVRLRLHQILCGFIPREDGTIHHLSSSRIESLMGVLDGFGKKACIWINYRPSFIKIREAIIKEYGPDSFVEYHGGVSGEQRDLNKMRFINEDPRWFLGNPSVGGKGLTLSVASDTVYFSNRDSLEDRLQSEDRTNRPGQHWPCTYTDIFCDNTVDGSILENLRKNNDISRQITRDNWRQWI